MKLEVEVSEQDLIELGKEALEKEMQASIKRLRLRNSFNQLSKKIRETWNEKDYFKEVDLARKEAWEIYRKEIGL
ncbi:MAG: hypothetical protein ACFB0D_05525 [Phormidesmis sp.]